MCQALCQLTFKCRLKPVPLRVDIPRGRVNKWTNKVKSGGLSVLGTEVKGWRVLVGPVSLGGQGGPLQKDTPHLDLERKILGKRVLGRGSSKCKGPDVAAAWPRRRGLCGWVRRYERSTGWSWLVRTPEATREA